MIFSIAKEKGGAGGTTVAINIAAALARFGWRVLLVDIDPQASATLHLGIEPSDNLLLDFLDRGTQSWVQAGDSTLYVVPGGPIAMTADIRLRQRYDDALNSGIHVVDTAITDTMLDLRERLFRAMGDGQFDCIIVDTPASGMLRESAMLSADVLIAPTKTTGADVSGLGNLAQTIAEHAYTYGVAHAPVFIVPVMYQKRLSSDQEVLAQIEEEFAGNSLFSVEEYSDGEYDASGHFSVLSPIPHATAAARAFGHGSVLDTEPNSKVARAFERVAGELVARLFKTEARHE